MTIIKKILQKIRRGWVFLLLVSLALFIRFYFLDKFIPVSGDLLLYADWGKMYWEYGSKSYYYIRQWYYAPPNYPPLINLYYAYSYKAFDYKYLIAELHNIIKFPPAVFIVYYYKFGYFINLKLLGIISDILIGFFIYKIVREISGNGKLALFAAGLSLFNPAAIILSSIWGQTDSVIALVSVVSFVLLSKKKYLLSSLLFTAGLLFKPNWIIFSPLYFYIFIIKHPKINSFVYSLIAVVILLVLVSLPFSNNPVLFYIWLIKERILPTLNASPHASISAFNFYTVFLQIDHHLSSYKVLGLPVKIIGQVIFIGIYLSGIYLLRKKTDIENIFKVIILIGLGSFLFMPSMLERYFFPAVIPFAVLAVKNRKLLYLYLSFTLTLSLNIVWALFRRTNGYVNDIFSTNNFLLIKIISLHNIVGFILIYKILFTDNLLKLSLWKKTTSSM